MVATNQDYPIKKQNKPKGVYGIEISGGVYDEDYLASLRGTEWAKEADKMRTQDGQIKMCLGAVLNPIRGATWDIISADASDDQKNMHRDFVEHILFCDMLRPWSVFLNEVLTFLPFGHSIFEIIHKNVINSPTFGSYTGLKALAWRSPKTIEEWHIDATTGELKGIQQRSTGDQQVDVFIPSEYLMIFTIDLEGNDFSGTTRSLLRPIYGNYQIKQFLKKLKAIGHEKNTVGTPVGKIPNDASPQAETKFETILRRYTSNQNQYIKLPAGFEIDILKGQFDATGLESAIDAENQEMVRAFLANFLNLGQGGSGGAYALGQDLSDFFLKGIYYITEIICDRLNTRLIPHLIDINFGEQDAYPEMVCSGIQDVGKEFSETIKNHINSGAIVVDDTLRTFIRKLHKLPPEDEPDETEPGKPDDPKEDEEITEPIEEPKPPPPSQNTAPLPNPAENEKDVSTDTQEQVDSIDVMMLQSPRQKGISTTDIIQSGGDLLKDTMVIHTDFIANKLIADIMNRYKNLPEQSKRKATLKIQPGGINKYKKALKADYTKIAAVAINEVRKEMGLEPMKFAVDYSQVTAGFGNLPGPTRDKILILADDLATVHANDLDKAAKLKFNTLVESTADPNLIEVELKAATNAKGAQIANISPVTSSGELVNAARMDQFLSEEGKAQGITAYEFFNERPVTEICTHLNGRIIPADEIVSNPNVPPLHFNCKSTLVPLTEKDVKTKAKQGQKISDKGLEIDTNDREYRRKLEKQIQATDTQIVMKLESIAVHAQKVQAFIFDREFFSQPQAILWVSERGWSATDVEKNNDYIYIRQEHPTTFKEHSLREMLIAQGIKAVVGEITPDPDDLLPVDEYEEFLSDTFTKLQNESMVLQTLIFSKDKFTQEEAIDWAREHDYNANKVDETKSSYRLRQRDPGDYKDGSLRTIDITKGIKAVVGKLKEFEQNSFEAKNINGEWTTLQNIIKNKVWLVFDKDLFSQEEAILWARQREYQADLISETKREFRLKQNDPNDFKEDSFKTVSLERGVRVIVGKLKGFENG